MLAKIKSWLPPLPSNPPEHKPNKDVRLKLSLLVGIAVGYHFFIALPTIAIFTCLVFFLKVVLIIGNKKAPNKTFLIFLTIISLLMILVFYGGWNGQKAGISYLVLLVTLKFLESESLRDYYIVCLILYFLASTSFLFNASITNIVVVIVYTIAITAALIGLSIPTKSTWWQTLKSASGLIAKAIPLTILLFFFFPRIQANIGFIPSLDDGDQSSQLNNSLVAGDFATGAFNNSLAFRAEFEGRTPPQNQLYWRSKVMPLEQNFEWKITSNPTLKSDIGITGKNGGTETPINADAYRYTILHTASKDYFAPYLDYVSQASLGKITGDGSVFVAKPENSAFSYTGSSINQAPKQSLLPLQRQYLKATSFLPTQRVQELLKQWQDQSKNEIALVQNVLNHFRNNDFRYSLSPPALLGKPIDQFLFESKTGYCEHYAAVFTTLMRWLDVPARIVVGYQGGDYNQAGEFYEVRYSDAHAWSEVLINGQWIRVDPTAVISPERIDFGMDALLALLDENSIQSNLSGKALSDLLNPTGYQKWLKIAKDNATNLGYQWDRWVINYNFDKQRELLSSMGIKHAKTFQALTIILIVGSALLLMIYFFRIPSKTVHYNEQQMLYLKFTKQFKPYDLTKEAAETPNEFASKVIGKFPHLEKQIKRITDNYIELRYGEPMQNEVDSNKFKQLVKQFKITPLANSRTNKRANSKNSHEQSL